MLHESADDLAGDGWVADAAAVDQRRRAGASPERSVRRFLRGISPRPSSLDTMLELRR
jgi:hypothetical protein